MAKTITKLNPEIVKQVKKYLSRLRAAGIPIEVAYIFGSQAKGTARADSDIDIAIVSPIFGKDGVSERVNLMGFREKNYQIEPHPLNPKDFNNKWSTFSTEVKKYGIPV
jgi:uncharacterized protein